MCMCLSPDLWCCRAIRLSQEGKREQNSCGRLGIEPHRRRESMQLCIIRVGTSIAGSITTICDMVCVFVYSVCFRCCEFMCLCMHAEKTLSQQHATWCECILCVLLLSMYVCMYVCMHACMHAKKTLSQKWFGCLFVICVCHCCVCMYV
jgi:hypothetical protein